MDVVAQAVAAAVAVVPSAGPVVLADGANVVVHLRPAPVVAKVAASTQLVREPAEWLARELAVASFLDRCGLAVVRPADDRVHRSGGCVLTLWQHLPHEPGATAEPAVIGPMLRELHTALAGCPTPLPRLAPPLEDVRRFLLRAPHAGMQRAYDRLVRELGDADGPALHGDPHPGNLLLGARGWTWADLEDACSGPVAWDLACLLDSSRVDGAAAVRAYGAPVAGLAPWVELRRLHKTAWYCLYAERLPASRARADELLATWR